MFSGRVILFTGLDGSGKTTQARRLLSEWGLESRGWAYRWVRWEPWLSRPLISLVRRRLTGSSTPGDERPRDDAGHVNFRNRKQGLFRHRWLRSVWTSLVLLEYLPQMAVRILPSLFRGRTVVCDRYLPDVIIDLSMNYGEGFEGVARLLGHPLARLFPRPVLTVVFDVDPQIGFERIQDGTPLLYLEDRAPIYRRIGELMPSVHVNANADINSVQGELVRHMRERFPGDWEVEQQ